MPAWPLDRGEETYGKVVNTSSACHFFLKPRPSHHHDHTHSLKDGEIALARDACEVVHKGMGVLHRPPTSSVAVLGDADANRRKLGRIGGDEWVAVEGLLNVWPIARQSRSFTRKEDRLHARPWCRRLRRSR